MERKPQERPELSPGVTHRLMLCGERSGSQAGCWLGPWGRGSCSPASRDHGGRHWVVLRQSPSTETRAEVGTGFFGAGETCRAVVEGIWKSLGLESGRVYQACKRMHRFSESPWCCRRLLRVPWTARKSNQSILKEIRPGCSLEGLTLKLKLQYFGHLMGTADSLEKTLMLGKIEGRGRRRRQRMRWSDGITDSMDMGLGGL